MALTDNLISYWKLDEASGNRADSHGSNTLTDNNTVASGTGIINSGADFEASNSEYLSCASNSTLQTGDIDFTIQAWIYLESIAGDLMIVTKDDDAANSRDYTLSIQSSQMLWYSGAAWSVALLPGGGGGGTPIDSAWYHMFAWHDAAANTCNLEVRSSFNTSGATASAGTGGGVGNTSSAVFMIGSREYAGYPGYFDGIIDEVALWKRVLTSGERSSLWNSGAGLSYDSFGGGGGTGQPTRRRWGGIQALGGSSVGNKGPGRMWGRRRSGIVVPRWLAA
jgi:Concanavalin A-like lectin/glucanases superfamily